MTVMLHGEEYFAEQGGQDGEPLDGNRGNCCAGKGRCHIAKSFFMGKELAQQNMACPLLQMAIRLKNIHRIFLPVKALTARGLAKGLMPADQLPAKGICVSLWQPVTDDRMQIPVKYHAPASQIIRAVPDTFLHALGTDHLLQDLSLIHSLPAQDPAHLAPHQK